MRTEVGSSRPVQYVAHGALEGGGGWGKRGPRCGVKGGEAHRRGHAALKTQVRGLRETLVGGRSCLKDGRVEPTHRDFAGGGGGAPAS